jgi:hypothetical protein
LKVATNHNNHSSKSISQYKAKVSGHIRTICTYGKVLEDGDRTNYVAPLCSAPFLEVASSHHYNHNSKGISGYEAKVDEHIRTIWAYRKV